jgi:hypothetical protein
MDTWQLVETGGTALVFAAVFVAGDRIHPLRPLIRDRRSIISFCAGMAAAYVFVHVMPELHGARRAFTESMSIPLRYEGMAIYFVALLGFLTFYGLDRLRRRVTGAEEVEHEQSAFRLHVGGFGAYVGLMAYLLVHNLEENPTSIALYAAAIGGHFLVVDHEFRREHGAAYERAGRFVLAGMAVAGWAIGLLVALPHFVIALLMAFLAGAVIMNSLIAELPQEKDGRFLPFMTGGILYGLILLPLG